jgi:hypothetical protein
LGGGNVSFYSFPDPACLIPVTFFLEPSFILLPLEPPYTWFTDSDSVARRIVLELQPSYFLDLLHTCALWFVYDSGCDVQLVAILRMFFIFLFVGVFFCGSFNDVGSFFRTYIFIWLNYCGINCAQCGRK